MFVIIPDKNYLKLFNILLNMLKLPYEKIISIISEKTTKTNQEIETQIQEKLDSLKGLISKEGAAHIVANDLGIKLMEELSLNDLKIKDLLQGMNNLEIVGKVIQKYELRTFVRNESTGKVLSVFLGDETGRVRMVFWDSLAEQANSVEEGNTIKITGAYTRENNNNFLEVHAGNRSTIEINPQGVDIKLKEAEQSSRKKISQITNEDSNIEIMGTLIQMYGIRFFEVCPTCSRRARPRENNVYYCNDHQEIKPNYGAVMNLLIDDGTDSMRIALFSEQIKSFLDKTQEQLETYRNNEQQIEALRQELLGMFVKVEGRVNKNDITQAFELISRKVTKADPSQEIEILNRETQQT